VSDDLFDEGDPRNVVLDAYPEAKPFADLITAETVEEYTAVARELASKVRSLPANRTQQPLSSPRTPKQDKDKAVSVKEAIDARDWSGFLAAQWVKQNEDADRA
jgi:hypothetical protein